MTDSFESDRVRIAYRVEGTGPAVLLIHGFASNHAVNWVDTGWLKLLLGDGRRVILIDNRGHGASEKLYDSFRYGAPEMAEDARRLLDHLGVEAADVIGYSMGARIAAFLALAHPSRVRSVVFGGLAETMITGTGAPGAIAAALEAPSIADVSDPRALAFRRFAEATGSDLRALAACMRGPRRPIGAGDVARIACPVLVAAGSDDPVAGRPEVLAGLVPGARALTIAGRDHMSSVGAREFKDAVLGFLAEAG